MLVPLTRYLKYVITTSHINLSVTLLIDITEKKDGSWHKYDIHVGFKDAVFEPYNCLQHLCELRDVLSRN